MTTIVFDMGQTTGNHDNMNAVATANGTLAAGVIIDADGVVVPGVSMSLAGNPFTTVTYQAANPVFAEELDLVERYIMTLNAADASGAMVLSGLPAGDYDVEVFGSRNTTSDAPATVSITTTASGTVTDTYNAVNTGDYAAHLANLSVTLGSAEDLTVLISHPTGTGLYAYINRITITGVVPQVLNIDTDNIVNQAQEDVVINMANVPSAVSSWSASIGTAASTADALVPVAWGTNQTATVDIPADLTVGTNMNVYVTYVE